jgi:hypothetical protein
VLIQGLGHDRQCWQDCLPEYGPHKTIYKSLRAIGEAQL